MYAEGTFIMLAAPFLALLFIARAGARRILFCLVVGMLVCLVGAYINTYISFVWAVDDLDAVVLVAPMVEEIAKYLPLACLISFFAGAATVGAFFGQLATRRRTGFVLLLGGALIAVTDALFGLDFLLMPALGLAMGAQNALGLRFFGAINRTTHMTGHITDCACAIGRMLGKQGSKRDDVIQLVFHGACLLVFALGAWLAAVVRAPLWLNAQPGMLLGLYLLQFQPNRHFWRKLSAPRQSEPEQ